MLSVKEAFKFLKAAIQLGPKGQKTRNQMIQRANELSSAILQAADLV